MIESIRGELITCDEEGATLLVGGVGLRLAVPRPHALRLQALAADGGARPEIELATHLIVRPDQWQLYGFAAAAERDLFRILLGIPGVGPRVALSLLSHVTGESIARAVSERDAGVFQAVPGIGKRTAERIVVELQGRFAPPPLAAEGTPRMEVPEQAAARDAVDALIALGVGRSEAISLVTATASAGAPEASAAALVAAALRRRAAARR